MKIKKLIQRISEVVYTVMKSRNVVEYNDYFLQQEIRELILPFINRFKKEVELQILEDIQMLFKIQSDLSCDTNGYRRLHEQIIKLTKQKVE